MRVQWIVSAEILLALSGAFAYYYWPQSLNLPAPEMPQRIRTANGYPAVFWSGRQLVGNLGEFDDPVFAYLTFDYFRSHSLRGRQVMLTTDRATGRLQYRFSVQLPNDLLTGVEELADFKSNHVTPRVEYSWLTEQEVSLAQRQTNLSVQAYNNPEFPTLDQISATELKSYVRQFISFKSLTDPRIWKETQFPVSPPSPEDTQRLAADIVEVAEFYNLPVDLMLGIGAMENNFLNAPGDLNNAIWTKKVGRDDIVLKRKGRRAWVLNSSMGIWQITRQSLRDAHELFLCDTRDYTELSPHLHPAEQLAMETLMPDALTTYAALLLRDLVDYFGGDVFLAAGAYNGTKLHPNLQYASGVETVATYARRVFGNAARSTQAIADRPDKADQIQSR